VKKRLVVARRADDDLLQILGQIEGNAGWRVAQDYGERFVRPYTLITDQPELCARRPRLGRFVRVGVVHPYLVIYSHVDGKDEVGVLRVVHGHRNLSRRTLS
jgi:toxin ParE1/3/4